MIPTRDDLRSLAVSELAPQDTRDAAYGLACLARGYRLAADRNGHEGTREALRREATRLFRAAEIVSNLETKFSPTDG